MPGKGCVWKTRRRKVFAVAPSKGGMIPFQAETHYDGMSQAIPRETPSLKYDGMSCTSVQRLQRRDAKPGAVL
jgi:hypothetical protein